MSETKVHVVQYGDCANLTLRWTDPETGRMKRRAAKTSKRHDALREAAALEAELNSGRAQRGNGQISWEVFRDRYEIEVVPGLAEMTGSKIATVFNAVERLLPVVAKGRLKDVTTRLSAFQTAIRDTGVAETTIAGYLAHLGAALHWAVNEGLILEVPKIKRPKRAKQATASTPMKGRPITSEEFERMLAKAPAVVLAKPTAPLTDEDVGRNTAIIASWRRLLEGLWWERSSGSAKPWRRSGTAQTGSVWTPAADTPCSTSRPSWKRAIGTACWPWRRSSANSSSSPRPPIAAGESSGRCASSANRRPRTPSRG